MIFQISRYSRPAEAKAASLPNPGGHRRYLDLQLFALPTSSDLLQHAQQQVRESQNNTSCNFYEITNNMFSEITACILHWPDGVAFLSTQDYV